MISLEDACLTQSLSCNEIIVGTSSLHSLGIQAKHTRLDTKLLKAQVPWGHLMSSRCQLSHQQPPLNASLTARLASIS